MLHLLALLASASEWPTARGPADGTQLNSGRGDITGLDGGYPVFAWRSDYSTTSYTSGYSVVTDTDGDGRPETLGVTRARVHLWDEDGTLLAVSDSLATPYIHGLYDLDGDGVESELVVVGTGVGGGVFVYNAATLALLWRSSDPGLNGGGAVAETAIVDTDGDGLAELLWSTSFTGYADYRLLSFQFGFGAPVEVTFPLPTTASGFLPVVAGAYTGAPGGFLVEQGTAVTWIEASDRTASGAVCSADESRCLRLVNQYTRVHASGTSGDRVSFDADGDGDAEYLSASANDLGAVDLTVMDPSRGLATDQALLWQYRYGLGLDGPIDRMVYASDGQGFASSVGGRAVVATVYGSGTDETDHGGAPADDCVDAPTDNAVIAFDALTGNPLATLVGARAHGVVDADGDGIPEVLTEDTALGEVAGWELVCESADLGGNWSSCADTGCALVQAWSVGGTLPLVLPQQIPADASHVDADASPVTVDLDGDGFAEILVDEGTDLVAWKIGADGETPTEVGRHTKGECDTVGGWTGAGADTWLLLEGPACHVVLDAELNVLTSPTLTDDTQGVGLALVGDVGRAAPVVAIGSRIYGDASTAGGMASPLQSLSDVPLRFDDLDGNGRDELIAYRQGANGDWRVVVYRWTGASFSESWRVTSTELGGTDRNLNPTWAPYQVAVGDYDGDGDGDIAFYTMDYTRGATAYELRGTLFFLDGGDGSLLGSFVAPELGTSTSYAAPMQAADLCAGATCPGTDGVDEVVFVGASSVSWYGTNGYLLGWSSDLTSEAVWGDFDRDGEPELALGAGFTSTTLYNVQVVELDGTLRWEATPESASGMPYTMHAAADVDEDGGLDLVIGGGYGEITAYAGSDGAILAGFPVYLNAGAAYTEQPGPMRRVLQLALADIDGDDHIEALVAHDEGYLYAVNMAPAEGGPSLAWSSYLGSPVYSVRPIDADGDGTLEVMVLPNDGSARLIDGGETFVDIQVPDDGACVGTEQLELSGIAEDALEVEVFVQGVSSGRVPVANDGTWQVTVPWPSEGTFRVEVWAVVEDELVASDSITVTWYDDADGDGVTECDSDCDDNDPLRFPGADDECDGIDADCDGAASDEADDDGDGFLACEECDDGNPASLPDGDEVCDGADNDCDGEVDEGDVCAGVFHGGGGCGACDTGTGTGGVWLGVAMALAVAGRRRADDARRAAR